MITLPLTTFHHDLFLFYCYFILLTHFPPPAAAQLPNQLTPPPPDRLSKMKFDKSMAIVLVILVAVFFFLGFLSVYTRQCAERRMRGRFDLSISITRRPRGLDREIIETFPTFVYSTVKSLKIGRATLECAVCLNEFEEEETLRLIPKCSHVFHPECIDAWLANHSTCPVCRANLVPKPDDPSFVSIPIPDPVQPVLNSPVQPEPTVSPKPNDFINRNRSPRSRSTGFSIASLIPRSHSTGHSLVQPGENCERFTLRLPEEVRNQLMTSTTLSRTKSCGLSLGLTRENSGRRGYRTRSVGHSLSPHVTRGMDGSSSSSSPHVRGHDRRWFFQSPPAKDSIKEDVGERSSDRLFSETTKDTDN
ncbi:RING-H2 finger protein ATL11 [Vigna radiata var. radiata]|uniref:RING-type E3 ubiquitin transferase n=1 Tax=Vigna radiata var. radiata TaxID=3916 RepID=A0A1S3U2F5_VIGRR|nr:RING-H2 finger protein ATL11 [Vigna radiata var. radiata]